MRSFFAFCKLTDYCSLTQRAQNRYSQTRKHTLLGFRVRGGHPPPPSALSNAAEFLGTETSGVKPLEQAHQSFLPNMLLFRTTTEG